jgi:adenylate kinase family enzyme
MERIAVIGCGGAGKSTLARRLGDVLGIEVFHLDRLNWKPGWVATPEEEWRALQDDLVKRDSWIIDGNYGRTMVTRLRAADTVIFLDYPTITCLYRAIKRETQYRGRSRPDMNPGCPERLHLPFLNWIVRYRKRNRPSVLARIEEHCDGKHVVILRSPKDAEEFLLEVAQTTHETGP